MKFMGIWGSSCGTPFYKDAFCERNMQWEMLKQYLHDRPSQSWTTFALSNPNPTRKHSSKHSSKHLKKIKSNKNKNKNKNTRKIKRSVRL
jgi:hypothetical protein